MQQTPYYSQNNTMQSSQPNINQQNSYDQNMHQNQSYQQNSYPQNTYQQNQGYQQNTYAQQAGAPLAPPPGFIAGASGNGQGDDTQALQRAIDQTPNGGVFTLPQGTYSIRGHLWIKKPITVTGPGLIQCDMKVTDWTHLIQVRADNCTFDGVQFYNKSGNEGIGVIGVEGNNFKMVNCVSDNFYEGVMLGKMIEHNGQHIYHSYIQILDNKFLNVHGVTGGSIAHGDAISFFGCTDVVISRNIVTAAPGKTPRNGINSGPEGYIKSTRVTVSDNQVYGDWDYPITTEGGTFCHVINNVMDGKFKAGIIERGENIYISGNRVNVQAGKINGDCAGIQFYGVDNGCIVNNVITGSGKYGIMVTPSHEYGAGKNTYVADNKVDGDWFYCAYFGSTNETKVFRNHFRTTNKWDSCVGVQGFIATNLVSEENIIQVLNGTGFIYSETKNSSIVRNKTTEDTKYAIYVADKSSGITIEGNDFSKLWGGSAYSANPGASDIKLINNIGKDV